MAAASAVATLMGLKRLPDIRGRLASCLEVCRIPSFVVAAELISELIDR